MTRASSPRNTESASHIAFLTQVIAEKRLYPIAPEIMRQIDFPTLVSIHLQADLPDRNPLSAHLYHQWLLSHGATPPPHGFAALFSLALCLEASGDLLNAATFYHQALQQGGSLYKCVEHLSLLYEELNCPEKAIRLWKKSITMSEGRGIFLNQLGYILDQYGIYEEAADYFRFSLDEDPNQVRTIAKMNMALQHVCRWDDVKNHIVEAAEKENTPCLISFGGLALFDDVIMQRKIAKFYLDQCLMPDSCPPKHLSPSEGYQHDKIRVGYISGEFVGDYPMTVLTAELFERHDRRRFEIFGYCNTEQTKDNDAGRERVLSAFDQSFLTLGMSAEAAARLIRSHEIDLLVDLSGLTARGRHEILRWKPAPIQITYLGYIGPIPIPELDYILCDDYVIPPEMASLYQPQPLSLGGGYQANDTKLSIGAPSSREAKGLPADGFVYCCFTASYKITEDIFNAWLEILRRTPDSVLWLAEMNGGARANLRAAASAKGIEPERLIFAKQVSPADYLAQLPLADLSLSAFPYSSGTLASDALRMGVPLLALEGKSFVARMAGSLLTSVGLSELIAPDLQAYMDMAVELAHNRTKLEGYRVHLQEGAWQRSLGDMAGFMERLEECYRKIVKRPGGG